ncbi:MAG: TOBE domain-containing protein, partial [Pseudomonadota bacterium]
NEFVAQFIGSPAMNLLPGEIVETGTQTKIKMATGYVVTSNVPTQDSDKGLSVNVGVRPEDMTVTTGDDAVYEGVVDFTEALGEVTILYFHSEGGANPVLAKMPGIHQGLRGKTVKVTAVPEKVQIFANGQSLHYRS